MKITFLGAGGTVTGPKHLVESWSCGWALPVLITFSSMWPSGWACLSKCSNGLGNLRRAWPHVMSGTLKTIMATSIDCSKSGPCHGRKVDSWGARPRAGSRRSFGY